MSGFTDYHAHFVYGVDDGARTREEMFAMLDAAAADGVTRLFATSTARGHGALSAGRVSAAS